MPPDHYLVQREIAQSPQESLPQMKAFGLKFRLFGPQKCTPTQIPCYAVHLLSFKQ